MKRNLQSEELEMSWVLLLIQTLNCYVMLYKQFVFEYLKQLQFASAERILC
ncbi:hypothetical protein HanXRQr2_Chr05g0232761 [Helianthus annuus]|uniref:Uncharacterized protein n=1 Tax=Helianthus annuus TaxID=4232 RepID=A0A9K3J2H4_HELAN|nr:hypothetical protein HanXRQr2_Chr05g0232761 [Helianthus annuus]KAJ0924114.1 hypothetical protein HanPSC8_Chr05g0224521 [Helianthus annuus]